MKKLEISEKARQQANSCRFCWMCRHVCPIGNATGQERNTARARALGVSVVDRGAEDLSVIVDNIYECTLCGACTNNCVTGWDPKIFIQEVKAEIALKGLLPEYVKTLVSNMQTTGNAYGLELDPAIGNILPVKKSDTLLVLGQDALYKSVDSVKGAVELMNKMHIDYTVDEDACNTGSALYFLLGKVGETVEAAKKAAEIFNEYKTVVIYDPVDLDLIKHEYKEWGIEVKTKVVAFHDFIKENLTALSLTKGEKAYSVQDNYAYARNLDDSETVRELVKTVGTNKEIFLNRKLANMAGSLLMDAYMHDVQVDVAKIRWQDAKNMDCHTLVTENPAEYEMLKLTQPEGYNVITLEMMLLENCK